MRKEQRIGTRPAMALVAIVACLWPEVASADPPWRRGHHHGQSWGNGWYGNGHGWHREHRRRHGAPIIVVPPPAYRPPPVVVIPGYAVPYGYGRGWGYAPYGGEAEFRLRLPIR